MLHSLVEVSGSCSRNHVARGVRSLLTSQIGKNLDKDVFGAIKAQPLPGIAVGIVQSKGTENESYFRNYGVANHSDDLVKARAITEETVFPIGSLSKNFTALGIMQLVKEGKIELDAPLLDYLPNLRIKPSKNEAIPMTVRHLLTHTSGIREFRNYGDLVRVLNPFGKSMSCAKEYYLNSTISSVGEPGKQYIKSHHNFGLAALLLEETTHQPLREYCRQAIFEPLKMTNTDLNLREDMAEHLTDSFALRRTGFKVVKSADTSVIGAGGGYSTTMDLARYLGAFMSPETAGNGAITKEIVDEMLTPQYRINDFLPSQALSFNTHSVQFTPNGSNGGSAFVEDLGYLTSGQGMNWSGHQNAFVFSRKLKTASVILGNSGTHNYAASEIANKALRAALPEWKLGTPTSNPALNRGLFPGHTFETNPKKNEDQILLQQSMGVPSKPGFPSPQIWPKLVGFWQVPRNQVLSARLMWLLGGELQVYQLRGKLMARAMIGPLRSNLMRRGPGFVLKAADPANPYNFTIASPKLALSTPARGTTDLSFDPITGKLHIGLITLENRPWYLSFRYPAMAGIVWFFYNLIGKGRAIEITTQMLILGF